jgi:hypothetical protein
LWNRQTKNFRDVESDILEQKNFDGEFKSFIDYEMYIPNVQNHELDILKVIKINESEKKQIEQLLQEK